MYAIRSYYGECIHAGPGQSSIFEAYAQGVGPRVEIVQEVENLRLVAIVLVEHFVGQVGRVEGQGPAVGDRRITSYNVCYTKLLREPEPSSKL